MSGHSKWATIHRQKGVKDAKKGAVFTKLAAAITMAVKTGEGVGDPDNNFRLRLAVDKARQFNMPKENISRAIEKGMGSGGADQLTEAVYEGFAPGGAAVMVEALTDNKLRTAQAARIVFEKNGGTLGSQGTVGYMFRQVGELRIVNNNLGDEDELKIIDLGIEDIEMDEATWLIFCEKERTFEVKERLEKLGYKVENAELVMKPTVAIHVQDEDARRKTENLLEQLEDLDDVQKVWTNYA